MRYTKWCFPAVAFAAILMICGASSATTRYVDPSNCPGAGDGTIGNPFCTIQDAINACVDGDVIELADGVYSGPGNVGLDFVLLSVTVRSANGPENCILDGEGANRHIRATEVGARTFIGLSFINGFATEPLAWGGAIYIGGITYIINCRFQNNMAQNHGAIHCTKDLIGENSEFSGGVAMGYSTSAINCKTLTMKNCTFSNHLNTIVRCDGGLIDQCVFRDNISTLADDRCIYAADDPVVISNSIFERNDEVLHVDSNSATTPARHCIFTAIAARAADASVTPTSPTAPSNATPATTAARSGPRPSAPSPTAPS